MREGPATRMLEASRGVVHAFAELIGKRLELFAVEWQEERARIATLGLGLGFSLICLWIGMILLVLLVAVLLWDTYRIEAIAGMTGLFLASGGLIGWWWVRTMRNGPLPFAASVAELREDRQRLVRRG